MVTFRSALKRKFHLVTLLLAKRGKHVNYPRLGQLRRKGRPEKERVHEVVYKRR